MVHTSPRIPVEFPIRHLFVHGIFGIMAATMDDAVKQLARLLRRGILRHKRMRKAWALLQRSHPDRPRASGVSHPHLRRASGGSHQHQPRASGVSHLHRPRASGPPRLRRTPTSRRSFQKCRASGPSRPHAGEGLSRPRASWCSAGLAGSSAHSCEDGRWMCLKGTPMVQTPGLS